DRLLVGEEEDIAFHGEGEDELHLVFNFPLMRVASITPTHIRENQAERLAELPEGAWPCNTFGNHDTSRMWNRYGDGVHDAELARLHIALLLTLKGTPFLYNGEEISMSDRAFTSFDDVQDKAANSQYIEMVEEFGVPEEEALSEALKHNRDRCRTPLQWRNAPNAGFSPEGVKTWLPVNANYLDGVNVEDERADPGSLLSFYKRLLEMRRASPALVAGDYEVCEPVSDEYLAFWRRDAETGQRCLIALNFSGEEQVVEVEGTEEVRALFSTERHDEVEKMNGLRLGAFEVFVGEVK
ncbi:MAG: alpha-amylase family glycosyl hydrolase, partial [Chloroflexia bacterium]